MELKKQHKRGIIVGLIVIGSAFFMLKQTIFFTLIVGLGIIIGAFPFVFSTVAENRIATEKEKMFLEFARNLVESVKMGSPISKSIIILKSRNYGVLSKNVNKLANQIQLGIPFNLAMQTFAKDIKNKKISRAITLIRQAERAGGNIGEILESVAEAVTMSDKLKKERKSAVSTLMVQGYIIFFVFLIIILIMQFQILPMVSGIANMSSIGGEQSVSSGGNVSQSDIANSFLDLLLIQGLFSGFIIGKLAEGNIKYGIKHSFILTLSAFIIYTGANIIF